MSTGIHVFIPYSYDTWINYSWIWLCQFYDISGSCTHMMVQKSLNYGKFFQVNTIRPQSVSFSELLVPSSVWNAVCIETSKEDTCLLPGQSTGHHLCRINSLSSGAVSQITYCRPLFACKGFMILSSAVVIPALCWVLCFLVRKLRSEANLVAPGFSITGPVSYLSESHVTYRSFSKSSLQFKIQTVVSEPCQWNLCTQASCQLQNNEAYTLENCHCSLLSSIQKSNII